MNQQLQIYSDGGARGNPGPAAIAFVAQNSQGKTIKTNSRYIGTRTNNQAEYEALILALTFAAEEGVKDITCHLDSELVAKQLNGEYTVKNPELQQLWRKVQEKKRYFEKVLFVNVRREHPLIQRADKLVNETLDAQANKRLQPNHNSGVYVKGISEGSMFVHTSVRTSNMDVSIEFYSKFFGLKLLSRQEIEATNAEIAFLQDAEGRGCKLELTFYHSQKVFSQPDYEERLFDHLGFEVKDINKTLAAMKAAGVTITDEPYKLGPNTTIAFVEDPDCTLIELIEHK